MQNSKSTKEIAREAVVAEFQRAGKRRKRDVDSSDDEDHPKPKSRHQKSDTSRGPSLLSSSELERLSAKYRDRVKERRDGISIEDEDVATVKFSVEDQLFNDVVSAVESGNRQKLAQIRRQNDDIPVPTTFEEAIDFISNPESKPPSTKLGIDVLAYLRKAYLAVNCESIHFSSAGRNAQQSIWTFTKAINASPQDRTRSWEIPFEQTFASTKFMSHSDSDESVIDKACVCSPELLSQMLDFHAKRAQKQEHRENLNVLPTLNVPGNSGEEDDDDDCDIFENVGEYNGTSCPEDNDVEPHQSHKPVSKGDFFGVIADGRKLDDHHDPVPTPTEANILPAVHKLSSLGPLDHDDGIELDFDGHDDDDGHINVKKGDIAARHKVKSNKKKGTQGPT